MSEEITATETPPAPPAAPAAPAVTVEHISAIHRRLDQIGHAIEVGFRALFAFVRKEAPVVGAGAAAVSAVVPGIGPAAALVEKLAGEAAALGCCEHDQSQHFANGKCAQPGCSCAASVTGNART